MLIVGDDFAVVYENVYMFSIEENLSSPPYRDSYTKKYNESNKDLGVSLCAYTLNDRWVTLGTYKTAEEAKNIIKSIGNASKTQSILNL